MNARHAIEELALGHAPQSDLTDDYGLPCSELRRLATGEPSIDPRMKGSTSAILLGPEGYRRYKRDHPDAPAWETLPVYKTEAHSVTQRSNAAQHTLASERINFHDRNLRQLRRGKVDTPYAGSWADEEARRPRVPITPEQERQRRAGIVHPNIANARRLGVGVLRVGQRVCVSGGGVYDGKTGVVVDRSQITTDGRGIPTNTNQGHHRPVDWGREVAIKLDAGGYAGSSLITMFKNRVTPVHEGPSPSDLVDSLIQDGADDFPSDVIPPEIKVAVTSGELVDRSWRQEPGPSFAVAAKWDHSLACPALMVHPESPEEREDPAWKRFSVFWGDSGVGVPDNTYETDDVNQALAKLRDLSATYTPQPTWPKETKDSDLSGVDDRDDP